MNSCLVPANSALQESVELRDDPHDFVVKLHQRWNNRLDFPPTELPKRYVGNELAVALELNCNIDGRKFGMFALVTREHIPHVEGDFSRTNPVDQDYFSVFVGNVEIVNDKNGGFQRIGGVVRLESFDQVKDFGICNSLYFSFIKATTVFIDRPFLKDRKLDFPKVLFPILLGGEQPDQMVQTGPQLMNDLASKHTESWWNDQLLMIMNSVKEQLFIVLGENWVLAALKECGEFKLKIADVLVGPY